MMSGDVISIDVNETDLLERQLSNVIGIPSFRINLVEDSSDTYYVVVQDHPHQSDFYYEGEMDEEDSYMFRVYRYVGDVYPDGYKVSKEEEEWEWDRWEISFSHRDGTFRVDSNLYSSLQDTLIAVIKEDMPEDTVRYMMDEVSRLWEERTIF